MIVQPVQQHGRPELRGDEVEGEQQWKQVGCKMMSTSLVTIFVSVTNVTNVVMICDNVCHRYDIFPCNSGLERLGETGSWSQSLPSCQVTIIVNIIFSSSLSLSFFLSFKFHTHL